jgi:hypothetical protein
MKEILRLRRFLDVPPAPPAEERCEFCGAAIAELHSHVVDLEKRRLACSCRPCYLLFTNPGAAGGRYRSVGDRYQRVPNAEIDLGGFEMPIGMAFFLRSSKSNRVTAFYPSPAGAMESGIPVEESTPILDRLEPDIEALLVYRHGANFDAWLLPVDACYELVGRMRRCWRGFDGGPEARAEIEAFFARLNGQRSAACPS